MNTNNILAKNNKKKSLNLITHLIDTANVAEFLRDNWLSQNQRTQIANSISSKIKNKENIAKKLVIFIAYTHDIGKAEESFQKKIRGEKGESIPHNLVGQCALERNGVVKSVGMVVGSHHGIPIQSSNDLVETQVWLEDSDLDKKIYIKIQDEFLYKGLAISGFKSIAEIPNINIIGQILLTGFLIACDRIASSEKYFPLTESSDQEINLEERSKKGINLWKSDTNFYNKEKHSATFEERFSFKPRDYQKVLYEKVCKNKDSSSLYILETPTGSGKTEAALFAAEKLIEKNGVNGLYFALPTQATANSVYDRINNWLSSYDPKAKLRLNHSKAGSVINYNHQNNWFDIRKIHLFDPCIVGTIDEILSLSIKQRHVFLKHLAISGKVVVFDEVHAYDAYVSEHINKTLRWLGAYNVPVIILSATLPTNKRDELLKNYLLGKGLKSKDIINEESQDKYKYPLLTYTNGNTISYFSDFKTDNFTNINFRKLNEENIVKKAIEECMNKQNIGIIVNSVNKAQKLYQALSEEIGQDDILLIHSKFRTKDRDRKENELLKLIGKNGQRAEKFIYIGTQVLEQSLDIDFDILFTELAPIDLLIQRAGRVKRHQEVKEKDVCVFGVSEEYNFDKATSFIYGDYLLAKTQSILPGKIDSYNQISMLINQVYNDNDLETDEKINLFKTQDKKKMEENRKDARTFQINNPSYKEGKTIEGWLNNRASNTNVRNIEDSTEIAILDNKYIGRDFVDENDIKEILSSTVSLPEDNFTDTDLDCLCEEMRETFPFWEKNSMFNGLYGVVLSGDKQFRIGNKIFCYDDKVGLTRIWDRV